MVIPVVDTIIKKKSFTNFFHFIHFTINNPIKLLLQFLHKLANSLHRIFWKFKMANRFSKSVINVKT